MEDLRIDVAFTYYYSYISYIDIPNIGYSKITTVATESPAPANGLKLQIDTDGTGTFTTIHQFGDVGTEITADISNAKTIRISAGTGSASIQKGYIILSK